MDSMCKICTHKNMPKYALKYAKYAQVQILHNLHIYIYIYMHSPLCRWSPPALQRRLTVTLPGSGARQAGGLNL